MERDDVLLFESVKATEEKAKTSAKRKQHVEGVFEELDERLKVVEKEAASKRQERDRLTQKL